MEEDSFINEEMENPGLPPLHKISAPTGYFQEFPDRVLNRWRKEKSQGKEARLRWIRLTRVAAAVLVVAAAWSVFAPKSSGDLQPISSLEAQQYIEENIDQFENLIEASEINFLETVPELSDDVIEQYLLDNSEAINPEDIF